jgi:hypothetical protein
VLVHHDRLSSPCDSVGMEPVVPDSPGTTGWVLCSYRTPAGQPAMERTSG